MKYENNKCRDYCHSKFIFIWHLIWFHIVMTCARRGFTLGIFNIRSTAKDPEEINIICQQNLD